MPPYARARVSALQPGGVVAARFLAPQPLVLRVGSSAFVHGGVLPEHLAAAGRGGLDAINTEVWAWVAGQRLAPKAPTWVTGPTCLVWSRAFSEPDAAKCDCGALQQALQALGAQRMVMGHTIQPQPAGISAACGGAALRVDVGMSAGCRGAPPQALELLHDGQEAFVLSADAHGRTVRTHLPQQRQQQQQQEQQQPPSLPPRAGRGG